MFEIVVKGNKPLHVSLISTSELQVYFYVSTIGLFSVARFSADSAFWFASVGLTLFKRQASLPLPMQHFSLNLASYSPKSLIVNIERSAKFSNLKYGLSKSLQSANLFKTDLR